MSLSITTPLVTDAGIELATTFGRIAAVDNFTGTIVQGALEIYASEAAFTAGLRPVKIANLILGGDTPYDRTVDGTDILDIAHDLLITILADQGVTATKNL